jgi:hypothetical protein
MLSALLMFRRLAAALRVALREEDFDRILSAAATLIVAGTIADALHRRPRRGRSRQAARA